MAGRPRLPGGDSKEQERVFADTNFFVALFNPGDSLHERALSSLKQIEDRGVALAISQYIFLEVTTVLSLRRGRGVAWAVGEFLRSDPRIEYIHGDEDIHEESWRIFKEISHKNMSFIDCSTLAVMHAEGIHVLLTYDTQDFGRLQKKFAFHFFS